MADKKVEQEEQQKTSTIALLFELENIGFQGRKVVFDVLKSMLADKDMTLTPVLFSRCCVDTPIEKAVPKLLEMLGHPRVSAEKLIPEILQGIRASLVDNTPKSSSTLTNLLKKAQEAEYTIGAVSDLDSEAAQLLYEKLEIGEAQEGAVITSESDTGTTDAMAWRSAARALNAIIPSCVVLTSSSRTSHAAVAAGMRCIVIPDSYTEFQDFGGVDRILDQLDGEGTKSILDTLAIHP